MPSHMSGVNFLLHLTHCLLNSEHVVLQLGSIIGPCKNLFDLLVHFSGFNCELKILSIQPHQMKLLDESISIQQTTHSLIKVQGL